MKPEWWNHDKWVFLLPVVGLLALWDSTLNFPRKDFVVDISGTGQSGESKLGSGIGCICPKVDGEGTWIVGGIIEINTVLY